MAQDTGPKSGDITDEEDLIQELKEVSAVLTVAEAVCTHKIDELPTLLISTCAFACQTYGMDLAEFKTFFNENFDALIDLHKQLGVRVGKPQDLSAN